MAITAKDVEELHAYAMGVMGRADHHAGKVKGIALALLGGIIWRGEPDSIRVRRMAGSPANMLWVAMLVDDRCLGPRTAKGGAWREDELKVFVRFLVPENPLGNLEQTAKLDQGWNTSPDWRLEGFVADPAKSERAEPRFVCDTEQVVAFRERANGAAFAFRKPTFRPLHQPSTPSVRRGIANRAESHKAGRRREGAPGEGKSRLQ